MKGRCCFLLSVAICIAFTPLCRAQLKPPPRIALINGQWFDGGSFVPRTVYSVGGRFTSKRPARIDQTINLSGTWIVPPFAEAHNHNIDGVGGERSARAIKKYLADGIFYVKIQGNYPLSDGQKEELLINRPDGLDVSFAQAFLTASGGHPIILHEHVLLAQGYYPGLTKQMLRDKLYFTIDSRSDLEKKWALIMAQRPDFIKANLWASDEFERRRDDEAYAGRKALDPSLVRMIVKKAHAAKLRVSVHVTNSADFHNAVAAGVDEITHLPLGGPFPGDTTPSVISKDDAKLAARRGIVVVTTAALLMRPPAKLPDGSVIGQTEEQRARLQILQAADLKILRESGVSIAVGSDNVGDSSVNEIEYLRRQNLFDNVALLKLWTETTPRTIFPNRRIGSLRDGYEASFLALDGDPTKDFQNVRKIKIRFKQGYVLEP